MPPGGALSETAPTRTLTVRAERHSYPIYIDGGHIDAGGLDGLGPALVETLGARRVVVISNPVVAPLYGAALWASLGAVGLRATLINHPDGEAHKNLETWAGLVENTLSVGVDRHTVILALGGGVTGDMAGFLAATLLRGLPLVQVPTTLLAMVDSAVGGKTGVNTLHGKNLVGAFHPPSLVYAAMGTLATLDDAEIRSGLGEVLKHGLLGDAELFAFCEGHAEAIRGRDPAALAVLVERSCALKARIVSEDEREEGLRAVLNLGHTVGHALERVHGYGVLRHGEAVAIGLLAEARWAVARGACAPEVVPRLSALMGALGVRDTPPAKPRSDLVEAAGFDKKRRSAMLTTPILRAVGHADLIEVPVDELPRMFEQVPSLGDS